MMYNELKKLKKGCGKKEITRVSNRWLACGDLEHKSCQITYCNDCAKKIRTYVADGEKYESLNLPNVKEDLKFKFGESYGIVRALKWVLFLSTYKSRSNVIQEIEKFIKQEQNLYPSLDKEERY